MNVEKNIKIITIILNNLVDIFTILIPLIEKILEFEKENSSIKNGILTRVEELFECISLQYKELNFYDMPNIFLKNIKN